MFARFDYASLIFCACKFTAKSETREPRKNAVDKILYNNEILIPLQFAEKSTYVQILNNPRNLYVILLIFGLK